jgi:hypothetical protein
MMKVRIPFESGDVLVFDTADIVNLRHETPVRDIPDTDPVQRVHTGDSSITFCFDTTDGARWERA